MDPIPVAVGAAVWITTLVAYVAYRVRLRSARFTSGTVVDVRELPGGEWTAWHPTIRYRTLDGGIGEFQSGWGLGPKHWCVGEPVGVKIYKGRPEIYDPHLVRTVVAVGIVLGGVCIAGTYVHFAATNQ